MKKIIRAATVGLSLNIFCQNLLRELTDEGYKVIALSSPDTELQEIGSRERVRTIGVPMERRFSPLNDIKALFSLVKVFRQERPDMVHSMTPKAGLLCMTAAWIARVPYRIHTFTGLVWPTTTGISRHILRLTDKITCACATHVVPEGQGVLSDLREGGITRKQLKVLGYGNVRGVDMTNYSLRSDVIQKALPLHNTAIFRFLFVGRIVGDKGINELVHAFVAFENMMRIASKKVVLTLIGWDETVQDPVSEETRKLMNTCPNIEFVGPKSGDDLLAYYAASDCFVFPSYREGFPNTVLEAGAMGLPSIVTDINGSREIIVDYHKDSENATGLIIPSKDEDALQKAMEWMVEHEAERKLMGANARPRIEQRWEQGFVRKCLMDFYKEVLGE